MFKLSAFLFLLLISVANCQYFYNYEEDRPEEHQPEAQDYEQSIYQYNPPSAVNTEDELAKERRNRRPRIRVRSRNYQSEPDYNDPQFAPVVDSDIYQRSIRQKRRRERERQHQNYLTEPVVPSRIFGPSMFENIGLGEAPSGVYIPPDSFINVLRNQRSMAPHLTFQTVATAPPTANYISHSINNTNSAPEHSFFVESPSNDERRQPNLILPGARPTTEYTNVPLPQTRVIPVRNSPTVQARTVSGNKRSRPRIRMQPEYAAPPTVDIDALREYSDDIAREDVMPQIQYAPVTIRQNSRAHKRRRVVTSQQETTPAPRVYSPSVFEKVGLGEAPTGVYVPEDSLLNILRNPSGQQPLHRRSRKELPVPSIDHPTYSVPNGYEEEIVEEKYQSLPPPPLPPKRLSSPRSRFRQMTFSRQPQREEYQDKYGEYQNNQRIKPVQPTSERQKSDDYEDFKRQNQPPRHRTQTQRRPVAISVSRTSQSSASEPGKPTFRRAKLAIAELPQDTDDDGIPGEAGVNYPTLHVIPKTSFSCAQQSHNGYYADLETSCQVVHLCQSGGVQDSFLCPNGTIFSQEKFSCQWWYKVNCDDAPKYYVKNDELYKIPERKEMKRN